jgi:predicted dehydrogenase
MLLAKSCHDLDILRWLVDKPCKEIASFGSLKHFKPENAPEGHAKRCIDNCKAEPNCPYSALKVYLDMNRKGWPASVITEDLTLEGRIKALKEGPYGRCVYHCDNDVVDHQIVALEFAEDITATFTMTAFDEGRHLELFGTEGWLRGGSFIKKQLGCDLLVQRHGWGQEPRRITLEEAKHGYAGHGGGDWGLMSTLHEDLTRADPADMRTSLETSLQSHRMAFEAEKSRIR